MSYLLLHPLCPVKYAISYEELVSDAESTIKSLFNFLEVPFHEGVMHAFTTVHAAAKAREDAASKRFTRKDEWSQLDLGEINPEYLDIILLLFNKYNKNIELSAYTYEDICQKFNKKSASVNISQGLVKSIFIQEIISNHNKQIESINSDHSKKILSTERDFYEIFNADQKWISQLEEDKQWLTLQNENLKKYIEKLKDDIAWHTSQREAWEKTAADREQSIAALTSRLHEADERLAAGDAVLNKIRNHWGMRFFNSLSKKKFF
jgi:hypothetical protein